ncbi:hypothetical protein LBG_02360 [Stenotrophomonas maltophilia]|nr:hypothetical protein LBG_02360 [Stenotrophomonas maltophilia]
MEFLTNGLLSRAKFSQRMGCWQGNEGGVCCHCAQTFCWGICETHNDTELGLVLHIQATESRWILRSKDLLNFG